MCGRVGLRGTCRCSVLWIRVMELAAVSLTGVDECYAEMVRR
jgi:hypothetical protein